MKLPTLFFCFFIFIFFACAFFPRSAHSFRAVRGMKMKMKKEKQTPVGKRMESW